MKLVAANQELLQSRLDAGLAALVDEANRGDPIWWRQSAWVWGLPTWSRSGRPFRGVAALLLWRAAAGASVPLAWQEAENQEDPTAIVIPVRGKRGFRPLAVVPAARLAPLPFAVPKWDEEQMEKALAALNLHDCKPLATISSHIRELSGAFVQSLRRHSAPMAMRHSDWTPLSLAKASWIAATVADGAYAAQVGKVFSDEQVWERGDVAALFPWEAQVPGGPLHVSDRKLKREGARVLQNGKDAGQIPMRRQSEKFQDDALRLDRVWERGRVLRGYGVVLKFMASLSLPIIGDAVLDAKALGMALAIKLSRVESLPLTLATKRLTQMWAPLKRHVRKKSWMHRLGSLRFADLGKDKRWHPDRLIPRARKALRGCAVASRPASILNLSLATIGLVRLLDAMGPKRPNQPPDVKNILDTIGSVSDRSYRRYPIFKSNGEARWLDVPNAELACAQKELVKLLRPTAPFAGVATAFEPGRSPALHARIHEGACAAVIFDISNFFGSIGPRHIRWAFRSPPIARRKSQQSGRRNHLLMDGGTRAQREAIISLLFAGEGNARWLPQGAPSSPWVANLAAHLMDRRIRMWARKYPHGAVRYSRYADDLVLSFHADSVGAAAVLEDRVVNQFLADAERALRENIESRGWQVNEEKSRRWKRSSRNPLTICGVEVPEAPGSPCSLPRREYERARAAMHHRRCGGRNENHGFLAWAWGATGQTGWLAWTNRALTAFAIGLAGSVLGESLLSGWADSIDISHNAVV